MRPLAPHAGPLQRREILRATGCYGALSAWGFADVRRGRVGDQFLAAHVEPERRIRVDHQRGAGGQVELLLFSPGSRVVAVTYPYSSSTAERMRRSGFEDHSKTRAVQPMSRRGRDYRAIAGRRP